MTDGPHQGQPVLTAGVPLDRAAAAMVMVHGRGGSAAGLLELGHEFGENGFAYIAPQAAVLPPERTVILGFSQGACLALEYVARNPRRLGGAVGLSGGLIGPPDTARDYQGSLDGGPVFLGCSDVDPHIPLARVRETAETFRAMGGSVSERIYPGLGHTVNRDEVDFVTQLMRAVVSGEPS